MAGIINLKEYSMTIPANSGALNTKSRALARLLFLLPPIAGVAALWFVPAITQPESYHAFADRRTLLGIPNFWNVISNLPFAVVGILGLCAFRDLSSRLLFAGVLLTAFGSGYYHLAPDTPRLAWDRAPMAVAFMALLALAIQERWNPKAGRWLLLPLIATGLLSVVWWRATGDLRFYVLVQFVPMLMILVTLLVHPAPGDRDLWLALLFYAIAKLAEYFDAPLYSALASGHTLKHFAAAFSTYWIYRWRLRVRSAQEKAE
jgi:hypothetical protein